MIYYCFVVRFLPLVHVTLKGSVHKGRPIVLRFSRIPTYLPTNLPMSYALRTIYLGIYCVRFSLKYLHAQTSVILYGRSQSLLAIVTFIGIYFRLTFPKEESSYDVSARKFLSLFFPFQPRKHIIFDLSCLSCFVFLNSGV